MMERCDENADAAVHGHRSFNEEYPVYEVRQARSLVEQLKSRKLHISTAESCTGGLIAALIVGIPGASDVFEEGYVTYSDRIKEKVLGVNHETLEKYSAVSEETALEMALGLKRLTESDIVVCTTGYAGPDDGDKNGLVYFSAIFNEKKTVQKCRYSGSRNEVRLKAACRALDIAYRLTV